MTLLFDNWISSIANAEQFTPPRKSPINRSRQGQAVANEGYFQSVETQ